MAWTKAPTTGVQSNKYVAPKTSTPATTNYAAEIQKAQKAGDTAKAATLEGQRNEKIAAMNTAGTNTKGYTTTSTYAPKPASPAAQPVSSPVSSYTPKAVTANTPPLTNIASGNNQAPVVNKQTYVPATDGKIYVTGGSGKSYVFNPITGNVMIDGRAITANDPTYQKTLAAAQADTGKPFSNSATGTEEAPPTEEQPQVLPPEELEARQTETVTNIGDIMGQLDTINQQVKTMGDDALVAVSQQWDAMSKMLNDMEASIAEQYTQQMNGDDPALTAAIGIIKQEADRMREESLEELNARGLVQSGVYAKMLSDMDTLELTKIQQTVGDNFNALRTQLNEALMNLSNTRIQALASSQSSYNSVMSNNQQNALSVGLQGVETAMSGRGQNIQNEQYYSGLKQDQSQFTQSQAQDQSQHDDLLAFNEKQLTSEEKRYYDGLDSDEKQFYAQLDQTSRLTLAQIKAAAGGGSGNSLAEKQFEFEKDRYAQEREDMLFSSIASGDTIPSLINSVKAGTDWGTVKGIVYNMGLPPNLQNYIFTSIKSDPAAAAKIAAQQKTAAEKDTKPASNTSTGKYPAPSTPSNPWLSTYVPPSTKSITVPKKSTSSGSLVNKMGG